MHCEGAWLLLWSSCMFGTMSTLQKTAWFTFSMHTQIPTRVVTEVLAIDSPAASPHQGRDPTAILQWIIQREWCGARRMPALNIYKSPITDLNEPFESDLGGNTMGKEWPCKGGGPGKKGSNYVVHECLGCWGAEEAKTEGGRREGGEKEKGGDHHSAICLWKRRKRC